jgi:predicted phosphodiesterase
MNKILFVGDLHLSDRQITTRVDDTTETCLEKLQWVLNFAKQAHADIIHTGDMFTHTLYSNKTRLRIKQMLKEFYEDGEGLSFWSCSGNHTGDIEDRDPNSVLQRELGQFCFDGYVNFLGKSGDFGSGDYSGFLFNPTNKGFLIRGYSAYSELDTTNADKVGGLVCHHWIMDAFGDSLVVYPDDMKKIFPNLRFIVAGHDHAYHEPYFSRDGVWVVRPGSVMRTDSGKSSDRIPGVELYYPAPYDGLTNDRWEYFLIGCARPYDEVFYSEKKQADADSANALSRFINQMQNCSGSVMDISTAIKDLLSTVPRGDLEMIKADLAANGFVV